jgi:MSHA biogenesis protein MshL
MVQPFAPAASSLLAVRIKDFVALIRALSRQGKVNVVARPRVVAMHNEAAIMRVGTQSVYFVTTAQTDAVTGRIVQTTATPHAVTEGLTLTVTPRIAADGGITMHVTPSLSERTGQASSRFGDRVPVMRVREADTVVRAHDRDTIVLAGLAEDRSARVDSKVPVIGDLPGVGLLFRRQQRSGRRTDLVILLTPTLVTPARILTDPDRKPETLTNAEPPRLR